MKVEGTGLKKSSEAATFSTEGKNQRNFTILVKRSFLAVISALKIDPIS